MKFVTLKGPNSELTLDATLLSRVMVIQRKKWWLFGPVENVVSITLKDRPTETIVCKALDREGALKLREYIESVMRAANP